MPKLIIQDLRIDDIEDGSVVELDKQFYPPYLLWSKELWLELYQAAFVTKAAYLNEDGGLKLIGNILVLVYEDRRTNHETLCFQIWTHTISKDYQRQGIGTQLLKAVVEEIAAAHTRGEYLDVQSIDLSTENPAAVMLYAKYGFQVYCSDDYCGSGSKKFMFQAVSELKKQLMPDTAQVPKCRP